MAMGKRKEQQESLFIAAENLPRSDAHPFYQQLNVLLAEAGFHGWIEIHCRPFCEKEEKRGKPSSSPGVYFRMLLARLLQGDRQPAWHRLAVCREPQPADFSGRAAR